METTNPLALGTIQKGKKLTSKITLSNVGLNALIVRRLISSENYLTVYPPKSSIKGGKKADLKLEIDTRTLQVGNYSRIITIITNDPAHSVVRLRVDWVVE
jgi:hypothetical protein